MRRRILILSLISAMVLTSFTGCKLFNKTDANVKETNATISAKADTETAEESIPEETIDEFNITPNVKTSSNEQTSEVVSETNTSNKKTKTSNTQNKSANVSAKAATASTNTAANTNTTQRNTQPVAKTDKERVIDGEYPLAPVHVNAMYDDVPLVVIGYIYKTGCNGDINIDGESINVQGATVDEMEAKAKQILIDRGLDPEIYGVHLAYGSGEICPDLGPNYDNPAYANEYTVYPDGHIEYTKPYQNLLESDYMHLTNVHYPGL